MDKQTDRHCLAPWPSAAVATHLQLDNQRRVP